MTATKAPLSRRFAQFSVAFALASGLGLGGCKAPNSQTVAPSPSTPAPLPAPESEPAPEPVAAAPSYPAPPAAGTPKPVNFPEVGTFTLDNGLTVYVVENHEVPLVSIQLVIRAGDMDADIVSGLTVNMLGEGTKTRSKAKIDEAIELVGGWLGAGADTHATYVFSRVLKKDLKLGLTLVADEITAPLFPADALAKQKDQLKTSINFAKSDPGALANFLFDHIAYPDNHPYGRLLPTPEAIDAVTVEDLQKFHQTYYKANNAFLVLAGDITSAEAQPLVKRTLSRWSAAPAGSLPANPLNAFQDYALPTKLTVHIVDRPESAQAEILIGNLALSRSHEDWGDMLVANAILGDDAGGRLFMDVREEKGLAYQIGATVDEKQAPGTFFISTRTRTNTTGEMLSAVFGHIKRMRKEPPTQEEVSAAVNKLVGKFPLEIETPNDIADKMREALIFDLPTSYWAGYRDDLGKASPESVFEAARKYIHPIPHVVIVGTAAEIEPQVRKVLPKAKIVRYDAELNRQ